MIALGISLLAIWSATVVGAIAGLLGAGANHEAPHDALPATAATFTELIAHNAPVALWPLALVLIGWPALRGVRLLGDALVAAQLLGHGLLVGVALASYADLWRYLPHLPLEWLALALPAATWLDARRRNSQPALPVGIAATACAAAMIGAAALETYLVPLG